MLGNKDQPNRWNGAVGVTSQDALAQKFRLRLHHAIQKIRAAISWPSIASRARSSYSLYGPKIFIPYKNLIDQGRFDRISKQQKSHHFQQNSARPSSIEMHTMATGRLNKNETTLLQKINRKLHF